MRNNMIYGYARVSRREQSLDLQIDELQKAGCEKIITDKTSGSVSSRPGLYNLTEDLEPGDTLIVWKLDRLGRTVKHLISLVTSFGQKNIKFKSLRENIDTDSPTGKLIFHVFCSLAEFERGLIIERTRAGLEAAKARGRQGGRPKKLNADKRKIAIDLYNQRTTSVKQICETVGICKATLYKYLKSQESENVRN